MNKKIHLYYYITLSIVAAILIITIIHYSDIKTGTSYFDRLIFGGFFITCCMVGISLAKYPGWTKHFFKKKELYRSLKERRQQIKYKGHHPDCGHFKNHTIKIMEKTVCTGCLGLIIGLISSIVLMIGYVIGYLMFSYYFHSIFIYLGMGIIGLCLLEILFLKRNPSIHTLLNILLVISFFLITISVFEITGGLFYGLIAILFSLLWLDTRIQFSFWRHGKICSDCNNKCKMY